MATSITRGKESPSNRKHCRIKKVIAVILENQISVGYLRTITLMACVVSTVWMLGRKMD